MYTDICIIIFLMLFLINGYTKGFVKSVYSVVSLLTTVLLLFVFDDFFIKAIAESSIGIAIGEFFVANTGDNSLIKSCSSAFVYLVSSIILYIVIKLSMKFLLNILDKITSLPFIKSVNKFLGMLIGLTSGIIWAIIILNILCVFPKTEAFVLESHIVDFFNIIFIKI